MKTVYASDYVTLDSNVLTGGGTDATEILQQILDQAPQCNGVHLIMDGAALIRGLKLYSNTVIECQNRDCGFYLADYANRPIFRNADWSFLGIRKTRNITLIGGTYNHNCTHQDHDVPYDEYPTPETSGANEDFLKKHLIYLLEFYGIENLTLRDLTFRNQRTYTVTVGNFKNVLVENCNIEMADHVRPSNQDGLHFFGPGQFLTIRNFRGRTGDDVINVAPDEIDYVSSITDVLIDGVVLDECCQGIRLLSKGSGLLDRVTIRNISGSYRTFAFSINPCIPGEKTYGNFGDILLENISLQQIEPTFSYTPLVCMQFGGNIRCLTMKNIRFHNAIRNTTYLELGRPFFYRPLTMTKQDMDQLHLLPSVDDKDVFAVDDRPVIKTLIIDGFTVTNQDASSSGTDYIELRYNVTNFIARNISIFRNDDTSPAGNFLRLHYEANVKNLILENIFAEKLETILTASAPHKVQNLKAHNLVLSEGREVLDLEKMNITNIMTDSIELLKS